MEYLTNTSLSRNEWITDPNTPDPENLPEPLGWNLLVRPYPINSKSKGGIILTGESQDTIHQFLNVGRVVSVGPCCWSRPDHKNSKGERFNWVEVGDFISWPRNVGAKRKFKGVSYVLVMDDEVVERLPDPFVLDQEGAYQLDIPKEHLEKYNTIYNTTKKGE